MPERRFALLITAIFLLLGATGAWFHECWRDEAQAFLVARDVPLGSLFTHLHWEGHPSLWYLALKLVAWTRRPEAMQGLHLAIAAVAVWVLARHAPFPRWLRALLPFGYFFAYEYTVVCRNYSLGILGVFAFLALWPRRRERPLVLVMGALLALTANTSVHALIVAAGLGAALLVDWALDAQRMRARDLAAALILAASGALLAAWQMRPPAASGWTRPGAIAWSRPLAGRVLEAIGGAFLEIPRPAMQFWNTSWLGGGVRAVAAVAVLVVLVALLLRRPAALAALVIPTLGLVALLYVLYFGFARHHGFFFVTVVAACWIARGDGRPARALEVVLAALAVVQLAGSAIAYVNEVRHPFSQGKAAARWLREQHLDALPMVLDVDAFEEPVLAYLGKDGCWYGRGARWGSYIVWDRARTRWVTDAENLRQARALPGDGDVLLLLDHPLRVAVPDVSELGRFTGSIEQFESVRVYRLVRRRVDSAP